MKTLWVFDLDGTLITSGIDYARAVFRWGLMLTDAMEHRAPHYEQFIQVLREIDKKRFKTMRAHRERFPGSMAGAYLVICQHVGIAPDPGIFKRSWEIGVSALSEDTYRNRGMIPGAEETLRFLQSRGDPLFCVTAGDPVVQWMKWRGYNLSRFFPTQFDFRVVKWDKLGTLRRLRELHWGPAFMVGDSIGSDLVPAAEAGYTPIYIPHPSVWDHGELVETLPERTIRFDKIAEIRDSFLDFRG